MTTSSTVKRSQFATFLNTGTTATPIWSLLGDGVTSGKINYNPQTSEEIYISQDNGATEIESYKPTMPVQQTCKKGDAVFDYIDAIRKARKVLDDAHGMVINVWLYETATAGAYPAEEQEVSIQIDDFGGDGGKSNVINYTLNFINDPILGTFNPTPGTFTATTGS